MEYNILLSGLSWLDNLLVFSALLVSLVYSAIYPQSLIIKVFIFYRIISSRRCSPFNDRVNVV